ELLDVLNIVYNNLSKIDGHSSDAARIVKAMGQLVRTRDTRFVVTDINDLITENVNKAAEEAMAELKEFKVKIETELDKKNLKIEVLPSEIGTVVNNIIDNAFYTVHDKYQSTKDYTPEIKVSTMFNDNNCEVRIKDNGKGIGSNEKEKLFQPFQTTKPTSQGVGLGLYISYDIIKTHNGNIIVNSKEGEYTEFVVTLPINN
ncbi:MAG TPA: HAMP domain-containing sensor histidine kinase, partial [Segetibacter sp.]|nr:HAMP domain-containing sensor histidine kinase [Segetibacter sp.]